MVVHRLDTLELLGTHQYDDGVDDYSDEFEREPFNALFKPKYNGNGMCIILRIFGIKKTWQWEIKEDIWPSRVTITITAKQYKHGRFNFITQRLCTHFEV